MLSILVPPVRMLFLFFFNDTATTEIYTLSLHDALPISASCRSVRPAPPARLDRQARRSAPRARRRTIRASAWLWRANRLPSTLLMMGRHDRNVLGYAAHVRH